MNISAPPTLNGKFTFIKYVCLLLLIFLLIPYTSLPAQTPTGKLVITITDIRSKVGKINIAVYDDPSQWTDNPLISKAFAKDGLHEGRLVIEVPGLKQGEEYAVAIHDDENSNRKMDNFAGLPREGFGMSKNPSFLSLTAPSYEETSFMLNGRAVRFEIKMNYIRKNKTVD